MEGKNWIYVPNYNRLNSKLRQTHWLSKTVPYSAGHRIIARREAGCLIYVSPSAKRPRGEWVLTGVGVRGSSNRFVTHVPNGGSRADFDKVIMRCLTAENTEFH